MATLCPVLKQQFFDDNGDPLAYGRVYTYTAGTLVAKDTYTDASGNTANSNPIILDAGGFADIWLDGSYKFRVYAYVGGVEVFQEETDNVTVISSSTNNFSSPYYVWSAVSSVSVSSGSTINVSGIDSTALQIMVTFDSLAISSSSGGAALRVGSPSIVTSNYYGLTEKTTNANTVSTVDWVAAFSVSTPTVGANGSANKIIDYTSSLGGSGGSILLSRSYPGSSRWYVKTHSEQVSVGSALSTSRATGVISTAGNISVIQLITDDDATTFTAGTVSVSQYANTGSIQGSNQGPFSNQYSSTGTNTYALTMLGGQVVPTTWFDGLELNFRPEHTNTSTAVTVNPNTIGAKTCVLSDGSTVPPIGWLRSDTVYYCSYNLSLDKVVINLPRILAPIQYGGTNANTAYTALDNLTLKSADIASATTTDLSAATGRNVTVTGTTTITGFGTATAGIERVVTFSGALVLTHNSTSLILPRGVSITTAAGDVLMFVSLGGGNWRCTNYTAVSVATSSTYISSFQAYTGAGSAYTFTHGLSVAPNVVHYIFECTSIDGTFAVGDQILMPSQTADYSSAVHHGFSTLTSSTTVKMNVCNDGINTTDKSFGLAPLTLAFNKWQIKVVAQIIT